MRLSSVRAFEVASWFELARIVVDGPEDDGSSFFRIDIEDISEKRTALHMPLFGLNITFVLLEPRSNADSAAAHALFDSGHRAFEELDSGLSYSLDVLLNVILMQNFVCLVNPLR